MNGAKTLSSKRIAEIKAFKNADFSDCPVKEENAVLYRQSGTAQYGTFSGDTFYPSGDLYTTDTTIRVVNGNLLTE
jgi:hypothetical protein